MSRHTRHTLEDAVRFHSLPEVSEALVDADGFTAADSAHEARYATRSTDTLAATEAVRYCARWTADWRAREALLRRLEKLQPRTWGRV